MQNLARSVAYSEGKYPDIIPTGINLMSNDVTVTDIESLYNESGVQPVSNPVYTIEDVYDILEKTENSFYSLNDTERKLLEAALKNPSTPLTVAGRIKNALEKEPVRITEAGSDVSAESTPAQQNHPTKKVTADVLNIRSTPGLGGQKNGNLIYGQEVIVDADSAVTVDGYTWVKIVSGDKVGWIATEYLEDIEPEEQTAPDNSSVDDESEGNNEFAGIDAFSEFSEDSKNERRFTNDVLKPRIKPVSIDSHKLQEEFNNVGDFDGYHGLQCPDIVKWFLTEYTTLKPKNPHDPNEQIIAGNGCELVGQLNTKHGLPVSKILSAPAIFSVAPKKYGPGIKEGGVSDAESGHTGIVLDCRPLGNGKYELTYIHTYNDLDDNGYNSSVRKKVFSPSDDVTYCYIGDKMKY